MTDEEREQIDRIEKDRRDRERELLILLLAICATSRSHAVHAVRSGNDPVPAARSVILGDNGGFFLGVAPIVAQAQVEAYEAGYARAGLLAGVAMPKLSGEQVKQITETYKASADDYARNLADRIGDGIRDVQAKALEPLEEVKAIRFVFRNGQLVRQEFGHLAADTAAMICSAYSDGMFGAVHSPFLNQLVWGFRYCTMRDDKVRHNHRMMEGVQRPIDDPVWKKWTPPAGYNCRCILLPLLRIGRWEPTPELPDTEPDDGFPMPTAAGTVTIPPPILAACRTIG